MRAIVYSSLAAFGLAIAGLAAGPAPDEEVSSAKPAADTKEAGTAKPIIKLAEAKPGPKLSAKPQSVAQGNEDIQDLVFRSSEGLKRMRLHVQVNGKSATQAWSSFIDK